jgi:ABC-type transport system involved in multi-copper enzyme maturation permease subunit
MAVAYLLIPKSERKFSGLFGEYYIKSNKHQYFQFVLLSFFFVTSLIQLILSYFSSELLPLSTPFIFWIFMISMGAYIIISIGTIIFERVTEKSINLTQVAYLIFIGSLLQKHY